MSHTYLPCELLPSRVRIDLSNNQKERCIDLMPALLPVSARLLLRFRFWARCGCQGRCSRRNRRRGTSQIDTKIIKSCEIYYRSPSALICALDHITGLNQRQLGRERQVRGKDDTLAFNLNIIDGVVTLLNR